MENVWVKDKGKDIGGSSINMVEESGITFKNSTKGNNKRKFQGGSNNKNNSVKYTKQPRIKTVGSVENQDTSREIFLLVKRRMNLVLVDPLRIQSNKDDCIAW